MARKTTCQRLRRGRACGRYSERPMTGEAWPVGRRDWRFYVRDHVVAVSLLAITTIAAALRFSTLGVQSFSHDDAVTAVRVLQPALGATLQVVSHLERS